MSMGFRQPPGTVLQFGEQPRPTPAPGMDPGKSLMGYGQDPKGTLGNILSNTPNSYDAQFEYRARRRIYDEMLSNLRPAGAQSNYIAGATSAY